MLNRAAPDRKSRRVTGILKALLNGPGLGFARPRAFALGSGLGKHLLGGINKEYNRVFPAARFGSCTPYFAAWILTKGFAGCSGIPDRRVWGARQKSKYDT